MATLARRIAQARIEAGYEHQEEFAQAISKSIHTVRKYERKTHAVVPPTRVLQRIATVTHRPLEWFMDGPTPAPPETVESAVTQMRQQLDQLALRLGGDSGPSLALQAAGELRLIPYLETVPPGPWVDAIEHADVQHRGVLLDMVPADAREALLFWLSSDALASTTRPASRVLVALGLRLGLGCSVLVRHGGEASIGRYAGDVVLLECGRALRTADLEVVGRVIGWWETT